MPVRSKSIRATRFLVSPLARQGCWLARVSSRLKPSRPLKEPLTLDPKDPRARYFLGVAQDLAPRAITTERSGMACPAGGYATRRALGTGCPTANPRRWGKEKSKLPVGSLPSSVRRQARGAAIATAAIPGPSRQQMQAAAQPPKGASKDAMIQSMIDGLEAKLKANPRNVQGWIMLMRSRMSLGEPAKAAAAYVAAGPLSPAMPPLSAKSTKLQIALASGDRPFCHETLKPACGPKPPEHRKP